MIRRSSLIAVEIVMSLAAALLIGLGVAWWRLSQGSVELITRAIALKGNDTSFHNNLGNSLHALGKLDEAIVCYRRSLELHPAYVEAYTNLGNALRDQGKLD